MELTWAGTQQPTGLSWSGPSQDMELTWAGTQQLTGLSWAGPSLDMELPWTGTPAGLGTQEPCTLPSLQSTPSTPVAQS